MNAQVVIVGGGVIGAATAYFLSLKGVQVLLLERRHLGAGATGVTASMINVSGDTAEPLRPFALESQRLIRELEPDFDQPLEIMDGGSLVVALDEQEAHSLKTLDEQTHDIGIESTLMDGSEACQLEPLLSPRTVAAVFIPTDFHVNPFRLCNGYLSAAVRRGAKVRYGVAVHDVRVIDGRIDEVLTNQGRFKAEWVVVAGGAYTPHILPNSCIPIPILPGRGQVIITEACQPLTDRILSLLSHLYLKQVASGNFYLGSHTEMVGFENHITLDKITTYTRELATAVPMLAHLKAIRFFAGFRPMSPDNLPVIGPMPDCPRLILATGHGRSGMLLSASTGKAVSELIVDTETKRPIQAFAIDRFSHKVTQSA